MSRPAVAVLGAGLRAPGGSAPDELFGSLCAARSMATRFEDERLGADAGMLACRVEGLDLSDFLAPGELRRMDRSQQLAIAAARDAIDSAGIDLPPSERCAIVCGVGLGAEATYEKQFFGLVERGPRGVSPFTVPTVMPSSTAVQLSLRFGFRGPALTVSAACASGAVAIGEGVELLRRGAADVVLAGGSESPINYGAMCAFQRMGAFSRNVQQPECASRPFDIERDGFVIGEGAGFVLLCRASDATDPLGYVLGYGSCSDAFHLVAPPPDGEGALRCMRLALDDASTTPAQLNHVNAHGTSTPLNDVAEAHALLTLLDGAELPVTSNKGTTGHMIAAAGSVEAIMTLWSLRDALVPPVAGLRTVDPAVKPLDVVEAVPRPIDPGFALTNSFGFGGSNASLVLGLSAEG